MYAILIKNKMAGLNMEYAAGVSIANAITEAENVVYDIVGYLQGHGHETGDFILREHPSSTIGTPEYYALRTSTGTYKIYRHRKIFGLIMSSHHYNKLYTIKIMRKGPMPEESRETGGFLAKAHFDTVLVELVDRTTPTPCTHEEAEAVNI